MPHVIEMRTYKTTPGMRQHFMDILVKRSFPAHRQIGMKVLGPFPSVDDPDTFFWMRGFPDLPSRDQMRNQFYEGTLWKTELEEVLLPILEKYEVVLAEDPGHLLGVHFDALSSNAETVVEQLAVAGATRRCT